MMIEFPELDGIDSWGGTGSLMLNIPEQDVFSTVHFGSSTTIVGPQIVQFPVNTGFVDPNSGVIEAPVFQPGF
jgi:hypothetical protein